MVNTTLNNWNGCDAYQREGENKMSDADIIYLAGFIDGEGCVMVNRFKRRGKQNFFYKIQVDTVNTNRNVLEWIHDNFGGCIVNPRHNQFRTGKNAVCYRLTFNDWKAVNLLKIILPYLKVKKAEAELAIKFQENLKSLSLEDRDLIYHQVRELKNSYKVFLHPQRLNGSLLENKDEAIVRSDVN